MPEPTEPEGSKPMKPPGERAGLIDLAAYLMSLVFVVVVVLVIDRDGHVSAQLMLTGVAGLVGACVAAWRRLHRPEPRNWRSGQSAYRGRRVTVVTAWGVEGQLPPQLPAQLEPQAPLPALPPGLPGRQDGQL